MGHLNPDPSWVTLFSEISLLTHALYDKETQFPVGFYPQGAEACEIAPGAYLQKAMLENASLWTTNLEKANFQGAYFKYVKWVKFECLKPKMQR